MFHDALEELRICVSAIIAFTLCMRTELEVDKKNRRGQRVSLCAYRSDTRMVGKHQPADTMAHGDIRASLRQGNLYTGGTPGNKFSQLSLSDS